MNPCGVAAAFPADHSALACTSCLVTPHTGEGNLHTGIPAPVVAVDSGWPWLGPVALGVDARSPRARRIFNPFFLFCQFYFLFYFFNTDRPDKIVNFIFNFFPTYRPAQILNFYFFPSPRPVL